MNILSLNGRRMHVVQTAATGVVDAQTHFDFSQRGSTVTAHYTGGAIEHGYLVGRLDGKNLQFQYTQLQYDGRLDGGVSHCTLSPADGDLLRLTEHFDWASRPSQGINVWQELRGDEVRIVSFTDAYTAAIGELILSIQTREFHLPITIDDQPDLTSIATTYQRDGGNFWVALHGDHVVGTIGLMALSPHQADLRKLFINAAYRGRRYTLAKRLLDTCLEWARAHHFREIYLETTDVFIAAQRFYQKNGFHEIAASDLPASFPILKVATNFYRQDL